MANEDQKEFTLERIYDASREEVWRAWTDPKVLAQWWGPKGVINPVFDFGTKPNDEVHIVMEADESMGEYKGTQWPANGVIKEIEEPSRLVFTLISMTDETGKPTFEYLNTVTFEDVEGKTKLTVHVKVLTLVKSEYSNQAYAGMVAGMSQSLEKLDSFLG